MSAKLKGPNYFLPGTVYDAALDRIRWLFDEFDGRVSCSSSGGKDSTVIMELAAIVAKEQSNPRPLRVHWLDQESEYGATVNYMRYLRDERPDIELDWWQIPFQLYNSTSHANQWETAWDPALDDDTWIRPKEPAGQSQQVSPLPKVDRFKTTLHALHVVEGGAVLTGMRCEESPQRRLTMTANPGYKWATWSSDKPSMPYQRFYPIYDWTYRDVWHSIEDHGWRYNSFYDSMFQYGVPTTHMRVSSFHHEMSMHHLLHLQEVEPETWERATRRLPGLSSYAHTADDIKAASGDLPYMFANWTEYRDHLIANLVKDPKDRAKFWALAANAELRLPHVPRSLISKQLCRSVIANDLFGVMLTGWVDVQGHPTKRANWLQRPTRPDDAEELGRAVRN